MKTIRILLAFLYISTLQFIAYSQCNTNTSICSITGSTAGPFTFQNPSNNPSSCLDFWNGNSANYAYIVLYITGAGNLDLLVQGNNNGTGCLDVSIFDITNQTNPCASLSTATEIACNYVSPCVGCAEFGSSIGGCAAQISTPQVNVGDVIMILVEDWSDVQNSFTLQLGTSPTSAQTGLPDATIDPGSLGPFCTSDGLMQIVAGNMGGTWSGPGMSANGMFDPAAAGPGVHTINYSIGTAPCNSTSTAQITVGQIIMDNISVSPCQGNGTYSVSGNIQLNTPPTSGQLIVENCEGQQTVVASAPFSTGSIPFNLDGLLVSSATTCSVHAYFTDSDCSHILTYTVPECPVECSMINVTATPTGCITPTTVDVTGNITFINAPSSGQLIIQDCAGNSQTFNAPFTSPQSYTFPNVAANGQTCTVTAYFTEDPDCNFSTSYTAPLAPVVNAGNDVSICGGGSVTLTASGATDYQWDTGETTASITVSPTVTTTYTVTGSTNGCSSTDEVVVTVSSDFVPTISPDQTICAGSSATITASGGVSYSWNQGLSNQSSHVVSPSGTTTYVVTATDINGCTGTAQTVVYVNQNPVISANNVFVCNDDTVVISVSGALDYSWSPNTYLNTDVGPDVVFTPGVSTTYTVTGVDINGCVGTTQVVASVNPSPSASFIANPLVFELNDPVVYFTNTSTGATSYTWNFGDGSYSNVESPIHQYPNQEGSYEVVLYAVSDQGCVDSVRLSVRSEEDLIFFIPNTFTPDGDEFNQTFRPIFTSGHDPYDYTLWIYNRWGELIFESHDLEVGWAGTYGTKPVQAGTYTWKIEFKTIKNDERKMIIGHLNLLK